MRVAERDSTRLRSHQHLRHVRVAGPPFYLARRQVRHLRADADRSAPATVGVVAVQTHIGERVVLGGLQDVFGVRKLRIAHRFQRGNADPGVEQQLFSGVVGIGAGESAAGWGRVDTPDSYKTNSMRVVEVRYRRHGVSNWPDLVYPFGR